MRRFIVSVAALVVGAAVIGAAIYIDTVRWTTWNTQSMTYRASVRINGTGPVTLILPAPVDARFWGALNLTNGTSSLRLTHTTADTYVVLSATADVAFDAHGEFVGSSLIWNLTHVSFTDAGPYSVQANVTIQMSAVGVATTAFLTLDIFLGDFCYDRWYSVETVVHQGSSLYPMDMPPTAVC